MLDTVLTKWCGEEESESFQKDLGIPQGLYMYILQIPQWVSTLRWAQWDKLRIHILYIHLYNRSTLWLILKMQYNSDPKISK